MMRGKLLRGKFLAAVSVTVGLLIVQLAFPQAWGQNGSDGISITADRELVETGQTIVITGRVQGVESGDKPLLRVFNPQGVMFKSDSVDLDANGNFSYELVLGGRDANLVGQYRIVISDGPREAETTVGLVNQLPATCQNLVGDANLYFLDAGNATYPMTYLIINATLFAIEEDFERKSLVYRISTQGDGCVKVVLPSEIIEAEERNFTVTVDSVPSDFIEFEDREPDVRTLQIDFDAGTSKIEIVGTRVVPEFPVHPLLVVATVSISLIAAITQLSRQRTFLN